MYLPSHFAESRVEVLHALMRERPFATLVTQGKAGPGADHLPLHLTPDGRLQGHVARANPLWRDAAGSDVLAIFHGPQAYVTPSWYATKREHGRAVPTWNYVVVHARGRLRAVDDAAWLRRQLDDLVERHESGFEHPWRVDDAPADYIDKMLATIVGIEIAIVELSGKWKISQNQPATNRAGVVAGLRQQGGTDSLAMAALVDAIE
ncbi:MAG: FMN-binding negative transcriptional regulator [Sterolibacteriaceae bacterium]|uniref:FMN-binding negative transcriptional regulator n=1 Tax=Sulfuritalea sp. TaxID=2480090 RepID=UPI001A42842B|nr:FMN-binding negative transcriptional regulator [Sulfuritalea sp.]MBL8479746.1 FMN-binding negative transcriptional regulator [Sterolibacteriaceae bacterium]MBN8475359.1 FMN-binding negative transcriptional regulator [Sulfuritalea sp.]